MHQLCSFISVTELIGLILIQPQVLLHKKTRLEALHVFHCLETVTEVPKYDMKIFLVLKRLRVCKFRKKKKTLDLQERDLYRFQYN